jgi:methylated-DNA-[protein]-cysteine S-methyltransferase
VVGGHGHLTGYAGGLDRKRALLTLEGVALGQLGLARPGAPTIAAARRGKT